MTSQMLSLDVYKRNANSEIPAFDLEPRKPYGSPSFEPQTNIIISQPTMIIDQNPYNPEISVKTDPTRAWEADVSMLVSTTKWLQKFGLKRNRLDMESLTKHIAFRHSDDYDKFLKIPVCSRYGTNLFKKYFRSDGQTYNIIVTPDHLQQIELRLVQAIALFKRRLEWLTSESRRLFGVIEERSVCLVLDFRSLTEQQMDLYLSAVERVLLEQISQLEQFTIVRAAEDMEFFSDVLEKVSRESLNRCIEWLWKRKKDVKTSSSSTVTAVMAALAQVNVQAVYLFTEGSSIDGCREIFLKTVTTSHIPVHIVSYNCTSPETILFLKQLSKVAGSRFHAYAVVMELDTFERVSSGDSKSNLVRKKKAYGGVPNGAGMRDDVIILFEEVEEAKNNLEQIRAILKDQLEQIKLDKNKSLRQKDSSLGADVVDETSMGSVQWLELHGLKPRRLCFYEALAGVTFKHQDGVVDLKVPPKNDCYVTDAATERKLINAKYCDKFAHVQWKDGQIMHIYVTPEFYRSYEEKMNITLDAIKRRIDWLQKGSREVFGTVIENQICLLIDTSLSMQSHIQFVKDKLFLLMQEQLRHKQMINIVAFNSRTYPWQKSAMEVNENNLSNAWNWLKGLTCTGTTNTLAALQLALADTRTAAVYLMSDGRPDQPPKSIIAQAKLSRSVPIHTISFNCNDIDANEFLYELAKETGGRFHYYSQDDLGLEPRGPEPWQNNLDKYFQSEDVVLLKNEIQLGKETLRKIAQLRDECSLMSWRKEVDSSGRRSRTKDQSTPDGRISVNHLNKYGGHLSRPTSSTKLSGQNSYSQFASSRIRSLDTPPPPAPGRARQGNVAGHTKTSLMRTLSASAGHFQEKEWMLPETRELLERQEERKRRLLSAQKKKENQRLKLNQQLTDPKKLSSRKWLAKNGLTARKLTIIDLIGPTFISHQPKLVPILNKEVFAKVFDNLFPIGYLPKNSSLQLANPLAVDYDLYEKKVSEALDQYNRRLDRLVWSALPENLKQEFDSDFPVSFMENETQIMQMLESSGWPVTEKDVLLLAKEIRQGRDNIEKARQLKEAAMKSGEGLLEYKDGLDDEDLEAEKEKPVVSKATKEKQDVKISRVPVEQKNLKVICRNDVDGFYYPGVIKENEGRKCSKIKFKELGEKTVATRYLIPLVGAVTRPRLAVNDFVLCRVIHDESRKECYVPGRVLAQPVRGEHQPGFYSVALYTGQQAEFQRMYLVKIGHERYCFTVSYIKQLAKQEEPDEEDNCENSVVDKPDDDSDQKEPSLQKILLVYRREQKQLYKNLRSYINKYCSMKKKKTHLKNDVREINILLEKIDEIQMKKIGDDEINSSRNGASGISLPLLDFRKSLDKIRGGEVLARWSDDGWYYAGLIVEDCGDDSYIVQDVLGYHEKIWREDIIVYDDMSDKNIRKGNSVVAPHPAYFSSYCVGKVLSKPEGEKVLIRFYDKKECEVKTDDVYVIPDEKYNYDSDKIIKCEEKLVNKVVVARKDNTGLFYIGKVMKQTRNAHDYKVRWMDESVSTVSSVYIFGPHSKQTRIVERDFVLASKTEEIFLPGIVEQVMDDGKLVVKFFDSTRSEPVPSEICFLLTEDYYNSLISYIRKVRNESAGLEDEDVHDDEQLDIDDDQASEAEEVNGDAEEEDEDAVEEDDDAEEEEGSGVEEEED